MAWLQQALRSLGYNWGNDQYGQYGDGTAAAVAAFTGKGDGKYVWGYEGFLIMEAIAKKAASVRGISLTEADERYIRQGQGVKLIGPIDSV